MASILSFLYTALEQIGYLAWGPPPSPKYVAFVGPGVAEAGKMLVHRLKTGEHVNESTPLHPEREENVKIGTATLTAFVAPGGEHDRQLFEQTIMEESNLCHGIIYLIPSDSDCLTQHKGELAMLLLRTCPVPMLVLVVCHGEKELSQEEVSAALGLANYYGENVMVSVTALSQAVESEGMKWLSAQLI